MWWAVEVESVVVNELPVVDVKEELFAVDVLVGIFKGVFIEVGATHADVTSVSDGREWIIYGGIKSGVQTIRLFATVIDVIL